MPADQMQSFHKKGTWGARCAEARSAYAIRRPPQDTAKPTAVPAAFQCSAAQSSGGQTNLRGGKARRPRWRGERCTCLTFRSRLVVRKGHRFEGFVLWISNLPGRGEPLEKANTQSNASVRAPSWGGYVRLGPLQTHRALRIGASATFPAEPQRPQGPLCDRTLLTRSFVIAPARLLSRREKYRTCAPRALAVAMLGPHHCATSPRARCQGGLPRNPQRRPSLGLTDEGAIYRPPEVDCERFADVQVAPVLGILARSQAAAPSELDIPRTARMT